MATILSCICLKQEIRLNIVLKKCFKKNSYSISNPLEALWYLEHFFFISFIWIEANQKKCPLPSFKWSGTTGDGVVALMEEIQISVKGRHSVFTALTVNDLLAWPPLLWQDFEFIVMFEMFYILLFIFGGVVCCLDHYFKVKVRRHAFWECCECDNSRKVSQNF